MNEVKKPDVGSKPTNKIFENRYLNSGSRPSLNSQNPKSYLAGFKKKAVETPTATMLPVEVSPPADKQTTSATHAKVALPSAKPAIPFTREVSAPKMNGENLASEVSDNPVLANENSIKPKSNQPRVVLTSRDLDILQFTLEMKFVSRDEIFEKYFSVLKNNERAKSNLWALERLAQLEKAGFLKGAFSFSENTRFYLATEKAHTAVLQKVVDEKVPMAMKSIDQRIFMHDRLVLKSRIEIEKQNPGCLWISDRKLRAGMASMFNVPSAYIPDAIYELQTGERVAFELENAPKSRSAYQEKISFFAKLMEMKKSEPKMFTRVNFRCVRDDVYKKLKEETDWHKDLFTVDL